MNVFTVMQMPVEADEEPTSYGVRRSFVRKVLSRVEILVRSAQSEVDEAHATWLGGIRTEHEVPGLDVAVNDAARVYVCVRDHLTEKSQTCVPLYG